ncbi:hypothetical protein CDL15_Pgr021974 [Punica granatum]|uniref:Uncharacterized protein n=1 Tax=Punica granatum TaxID=22663 RepID=A0A218WW69_PUNGR|nr:hypothetical protein CDL15_Pgr021974 [Punica granatum]
MYSGVHRGGGSSSTRLDARAGEQELTGARRRGDGHERRQANVGLVRTCMHAGDVQGAGVRTVTSAGTRTVTDE